MVSELEFLSQEERLPAKGRSAEETEAQGQELGARPSASTGGAGLLPSLLPSLAPGSLWEEASESCPREPGRLLKCTENLHLN